MRFSCSPCAAAGLAIGAGVSMLHNGLGAHATPTVMEAMLARNARYLAFPANARNEHNPVTPSFIRHLPQLTMEERVEMERDNPKRHH